MYLCRHSVLDTESQNLSKGDDVAIADHATLVRNDGKQQTVKNLFTYLPIHLFTSKKVAFTLAEILITLGIIGVVAALTMPNLIANYQNKVLSTQLKKVVNNIDNGAKALLAKEGVDSLADTQFYKASGGSIKCAFNENYFVQYFNLEPLNETSKFAIFAITENSKSKGHLYQSIDGSNWVILTNFDNGQPAETSAIFDINGDKGPNKWGYDRYYVPLSATINPWSCGQADTLLNSYGKLGVTEYKDAGISMDYIKELVMDKNLNEDEKLESMFALGLLLRYYDGWNIEY